MTRASTIPRRAVLRRHSAYTSPDGSRSAHLEVWSAEISLGAASHYRPIPARWYVLRVGFGRPQDMPAALVWRYTGARLNDATRDQLAAIAKLRAAGWVDA